MATTPTPPVARAERILIIKPSSLGDVVHALPVLAALRAAHPHAHVAWLVSTSFAPLLEGHPLLDEVIPFDRRRYGRLWRSPRILTDFLRFVWRLRRRRFDLVLDLQGLFRSGLLARATGARRRIGFAAARECAWAFYTQRVACPASAVHAVDRNLCLARAAGLTVATPQFPLALRAAELDHARALLVEKGATRFLAVIPGGRWPSKLWRMDRLAALIDRLAADGLPPVVLLGGPDDRALADDLRRGCRASAIDLVGQTSLRTLAAVIALADLVICHDSGPMHIAAALDKPIVAIFGPTNPARTGPVCRSARIVALPLDCAPCYRRTCPLGHHHCMEQLSIETVLAEVRKAWPRG